MKTDPAISNYERSLSRDSKVEANESVESERYFKSKQEKMSFKAYDRIIKKYPILSREEVKALESDPDRINKLILHNIRLVIKLVRYYEDKGLEVNDLIGYGIIGLREAAERFDFSMDAAFSTYSTWWIKQAMSSAIQKKGNIIRVPYHVHDDMGRYLKVVGSLTQKLGRYPTKDDVKKHSGIDEKNLNRMLKADKIMHPISMHEQVNGTGMTVEDLIHAQDEPTVEDIVSTIMKKEAISKILYTLSLRDMYVIKMLLGFYADMEKNIAMKEIKKIPKIIPVCSCDKAEGTIEVSRKIRGCVFRNESIRKSSLNGCLLQNSFNTLEDVGKTLGLTRERIRQIEAGVIKKLRHPKRLRILSEHI